MKYTAIMYNGRDYFEFHFQSDHKVNSKTNRDDCIKQYTEAFGNKKKMPIIIRIEKEKRRCS